ncbi:MAG: hypothetical protein JO356_16320 [Acidobacteria bacterium]|nr:hypothetical protein [Acidobacteriota bacterium]
MLTSMGMAALSAALTLTMISLIRHHLPEKAREQPRSLPSVVRPIPPAEARHVPSHSLGRRSALEKTNTVNSAVLAGQATRAGKAPRAHYSEDSDYVARDTYIYYGPKGKSEH